MHRKGKVVSGRRFSLISPSNYLKNRHFLRLEIVHFLRLTGEFIKWQSAPEAQCQFQKWIAMASQETRSFAISF